MRLTFSRDIAPILPLAYENFTSALKLKTLVNGDSSQEDENEESDSQDISDEEPEVCTKYENLNKRDSKKHPSIKNETVQPFN